MASFRKIGKKWYYRVVDADGIQRERAGCSDRRETERMAAAVETEIARERAGLSDPRAKVLRRYEATPIGEHLDDFRATLLAKGDTAKHVGLFVDRARRVVAIVLGGRLDVIDPPKRSTRAQREVARDAVDRLLAGGRLSDLTGSRVQSALSTLRESSRSLATCNHHRTAIRGFSRWAWHDGRTRDDALVGVSGFNAKEDRRHDRRTISVDELRSLIAAAEAGKPYRKMTGKARALCYRLAVATGLRYSEIGSIRPESFAADWSVVTVEAGYTKNGEPARLDIPPDLAGDLRAFVAAIKPGEPIFALPERGADMLRIDLEPAGIEYRDASGQVFDFHSLRCQHATLLDAAGISPRVVQKMMRHSTLELTGRYTRPQANALRSAAESLPSLRPEPAPPTGGIGQIGNRPPLHFPYAGDTACQGEALPVQNEATPAEAEVGRKSFAPSRLGDGCHQESGLVQSSGVQIRTGDLRFMSPLL